MSSDNVELQLPLSISTLHSICNCIEICSSIPELTPTCLWNTRAVSYYPKAMALSVPLCHTCTLLSLTIQDFLLHNIRGIEIRQLDYTWSRSVRKSSKTTTYTLEL